MQTFGRQRNLLAAGAKRATVAAPQRSIQQCLLHVVVDAGLGRSDVTVVSIVVPYDRRRTSVLQASNGFDQLDLQNAQHDPSPRLS
jgi:hypothetical protein